MTDTGKDTSELILASRSPRRRELLRLLGIPFRVVAPDAPEGGNCLSPAVVQASTLAEAKAISVARENPDSLVIGADTLVVLDSQVMGKPSDALSAREMLGALCHREHRVITGLAVLQPRRTGPEVQTVETRVWMREYRDQEIAAYIARGEPFDKAGAYAIQDESFHPVERIQGCYANVVGLPLCHLFVALERLDFGLSPSPRRACEGHLGRTCMVAERILGCADR